MKLGKKIISILTMLLCIGVLLTATGCGEKTTPKESAQFFFDLMIKQDTTNIDKFGMTEESVKDLLKTEKDTTKTQTRGNFTKAGLTISDEKLDAIVDAQYNALKLLTATVDVTSESGDKATLVIKNTYIDFTALDEKAANDAVETVKALGLTDQKEALDKLTAQYIENLLAALKSATPSTDMNEATYEFKEDSGEWVPSMDSAEFGKQLATLSLGKK